jgi:hypothetical protein
MYAVVQLQPRMASFRLRCKKTTVQQLLLLLLRAAHHTLCHASLTTNTDGSWLEKVQPHTDSIKKKHPAKRGGQVYIHNRLRRCL